MNNTRTILLLCLLASSISYAEPLYAGQDYLNDELRAQVQALKTDVAEGKPTTLNNIDARLDVLWPWANALSQQGVHIPVELPRLIAQGRQRDVRRQYAFVVLPAINGLVRELQIKEEQPAAVGAVTANTTGPWPVRSMATFEQSYTIGEMPMQPGGGVLVAWELVARLDPFNRTDPAAKNYISIRSSNPDARWEESEQQILGMHGNIFNAVGMPTYILRDATLEKGDTITVTYGDTSGGSPGLELQTTAVKGALFPLYVDLEGNGNFMSPRWPEFDIVGGPPERVVVFAPSVITPGETFALKVRVEDNNYNLAAGETPDLFVRRNDPPATTGDDIRIRPNGAVVSVDGLQIDASGVHRYTVASRDGSLRGESNPIWVTPDPQYRVYWGDTHAHTNLAEGQGTIDNFFYYARHDAGLDFVTLSEHDIWMDDSEWTALREAVKKYDDPPNFTTFLAYEWTAIVELGGHHNVFFRTPNERARVPIQETDGLWDLFDGLDANFDPSEVMLIPHAHIPGDWRLAHPKYEPLVEIVSMHGTFEWFGNYYLRNGHTVGFVGATDDHAGRPGYSGGLRNGPLQQFGGLAAVLAPKLDSGTIFDAMQERLAYATNGQRTILDLRLNGELMGRRMDYAPARTIEGQVMATAPIDTIDVIKNSEVVSTTNFLDQSLDDGGWLEVSFYSQSEDLIRDAPRGFRTWTGTLTVQGASIAEVRPVSLANYEKESVTFDDTDPARVAFSLVTRGRENRLLLKLTEISDDTTIRIETVPTPEEGVTFPRFYQPVAAVKPVDVTFNWDEFANGVATRDIPAGRYTDTIRLRGINPDGPMDRTFSWTDPDEPADGDYYYVRVTQLDGKMAWSSPWWVGGIPVR